MDQLVGRVKPQIIAGSNGMPKVVLSHESGSLAEVYLHGAHVTSWVPAGRGEMLFLSEKAVFAEGKAIRGGIPVVFPQFADSGPLPKHGWLRTTEWRVRDISPTSVVLAVEENPGSLSLWPHPYHVELAVTLGETSLQMNLQVQNPGAEAFMFTAALHTYLAVDDVRRARLLGLERSEYIDKTRGGVVVPAGNQPLTIISETDRIYRDAPKALRLRDSRNEGEVTISSSGFTDVVVWNPWADVARGIADMEPDEYLRMVCVEAAVAVDPVILGATESWSGSQRLTVA